jgi:hypothetical protein
MLLFGCWLIGFGVMIWRSSEHPKSTQQTKSAHTAEQKSQKDITDERLADYTLLLAWFTGILAVSTIGLWIVTWRASIKQARDMGASIKIADAAAVAAERAAKAASDTVGSLMRAERPHMIFDRLKLTGVRGTPNTEGLVKLFLDFQVVNFGRTPAFPKAISLQLRFEDTLPIGVPYSALQQINGVTAPTRGYGPEWPTECLAPTNLIQPVIDGVAHVFVIGYFRYEDVFEAPHETGFAYRLIFDAGADGSKHFTAVDDGAYWRYT